MAARHGEAIDQTILDTNTPAFTDRGFRLATEPKITMPDPKQKEFYNCSRRQIRPDLHRLESKFSDDPARRFQEFSV